MAEQSAHLVELAERIGPRPATSDAEAKAAEYVADVLRSRGLEPETDEFDTPRTYSWAYVIYHTLTIAAAVASRWFPWPAFAVAAVVAVLMWRDLDTKWGLSAIMPKGPSQNVFARHVPKQRRGESLRRVVVVAHYDSAKASLAFSPALVKNFGLTFWLTKACTIWTPVLILAAALPYVGALVKPYPLVPWYVTLAGAVYLLVPLLVNIHRELFMKATPGANDNASGVAAMLGVMERLVPEPDADVFETSSLPRIDVRRRSEEEARDAGVVPAESVLAYTPSASPHRPPFDEHDFDDAWGDDRPSAPARGQTAMSLGADDEDEVVWEEPRRAESAPAEPRISPLALPPEGEDVLPSAYAPEPSPQPKRRGFLGRKRKEAPRSGEVRDWLGVDEGFDAKEEGKKIGSWDKFEDDDDEIGWKGGSAGGAGIDDPDFAADEAARIRRRVTAGVDHALVEKEVWFLATGAEEAGTRGMLDFIARHGDELRDAHFINLDNLGSGNLAWIASEGMAKRYKADRRLSGAARRVASENAWQIKGSVYKGLSTDATPLLARRFKAMSVMAFDINGRLPNWHWQTDTIEEVQPENIDLAVEFVATLIKEL